MKAVILAGGKGQRLGYLAKEIPKPMIEISGKPILEHAINLMKKNGIKDIIVTLSHLSEKVKEYFQDGEKFGVNIEFFVEKEPLGTSGALKFLKEKLQEDFIVFYGDNITNLNLSSMIEFHKKNNSFATLYLYHEKMADEKTTPGCVIIDENKKIKRMIENPNEDQIKEIKEIPLEFKFTNSGIYVLNPKIIDLIPEGKSDFAKDIFPSILNKELNMYGYNENCYIRELGQIHRYEKAKQEIESGEVSLK